MQVQWVEIVQRCQDQGYAECALDLLAAVTAHFADRYSAAASRNLPDIERIAQISQRDEEEGKARANDETKIDHKLAAGNENMMTYRIVKPACRKKPLQKRRVKDNDDDSNAEKADAEDSDDGPY